MKEFVALWQRLFGLLLPRERAQMLAVFVVSVVVAVLETMGVASVLPFMAVVMDPSAFERYGVLRQFTSITGLTDTKQRLVAIGVTVALVILLSNVASAVALWSQQKMAAKIRIRLSIELFRRFMFQPYAFHVAHDGSALQTVMMNDIDALGRMISAAIQFASRVFVVVALVTLLLLQNPIVAIWTGVVLGGSYAVIYAFVRDRQTRLGAAATDSWSERHRIAQESLAGVKELQVLGREEHAVQQFGVQARILANVIGGNILLSGIPRYILEPIGFGGILSVALYMILTSPNAAATAIPTLALYAFVGYRLLPAMQQIYAAAGDVKYAMPAVLTLHRYYTDAVIHPEQLLPSPAAAVMPRGRSSEVVIALDKVTFKYAGAERPALDSVTVDILRGQSVGIVGKSGSGKTTLADIILGLYLPNSGVIRTPDGILDARTVRQWHRRLGYVPQHVFLSNASVLENIAFGLHPDSIDRAAAERAAIMAHAVEFIDALTNGIDTVIGERGIVLSGGQRQRLGIARALYTNPEVLVFDEATSALDGLTETSVMDAIHALTGERTVILIAHRLQTIEACDRIIHLSAGRVVDEGRFDDLLNTSASFREFTNRVAPTKNAIGRSVA